VISNQSSPSYSPISETSERTPKRAKTDFCSGYKPVFEYGIFQMFPIQYLSTQYNRQWRVCFESSAFYSLNCWNKNCLLETRLDENTCFDCEMLQHNNDLKKVLERTKLNDTTGLNHQLLNYRQLKHSNESKADQLNKFKLQTLNLQRSNISLMNRTNDYHRLMKLVSQNDVPRIKQLISACLKSRVSINTMTERVCSAINGKILSNYEKLLLII
jgi:hypothetical protein